MKIGVIGAGVMGSNHSRVLSTIPHVELLAIVDPNLDLAKKHAKNLKTTALASVDELIALKPDAVIVASPTHFHYDIALQLIDAGIHLLIEKPITPNVEEGRALLNAAKSKGVTLSVGHVERFNPAVLALKKAVAGEEMLSVQITRVGPFPPRMSNVGVVIDLAVHDIDLISYFTDSPIVDIQPQIAHSTSDHREDFALLQFKTANGILAHINTNWLTPFKARNVVIATKKKYIFGDLITRQVTEYSNYKEDGSYSMKHLPVAYAEPLKEELLSFIDAVKNKKTPEVTGEQGVAAIEVAIRCLNGGK